MTAASLELLLLATASQIPVIALAGLARSEQRFAPLPVLPRLLIPGALLAAALALALSAAAAPELAALVLISAALALFAGLSGRALGVTFYFALLTPLLAALLIFFGAGG